MKYAWPLSLLSIWVLICSVIVEIECVHERLDLKSNCIGESNLFFWKKRTMRLCNNFAKSLLREVRRLNGRYFSRLFWSFFLKSGITLAVFMQCGTLRSFKQILKAFIKKKLYIIGWQHFIISLLISSWPVFFVFQLFHQAMNFIFVCFCQNHCCFKCRCEIFILGFE